MHLGHHYTVGLVSLKIGCERSKKTSDYCFGTQQQVSWEIQYSYCALEKSYNKKTALNECADLSRSISLANASQVKRQNIYFEMC